MAMPEIQQVNDLALKYDNRTLGRLAQIGIISPILAVLAGMRRDRFAQSKMKRPEKTVAQDVFTSSMGVEGFSDPTAVQQPQMPPQMPQQPQPQGQGLNQVPVPPQMFERQGMAGGGIVAFQGGGTMPTFADMYSGLTPDLEALAAARQAYMGELPAVSRADRKQELLNELLVRLGGKVATTPGGLGQALSAGAQEISQPLMTGLRDIRNEERARQMAQRAEKGKVFEGVLGARQKAAEAAAAESRLQKELKSREDIAEADRKAREEIERANRESREAIASLPNDKERAAQIIFDDARAAGMPISMEQAMTRATAALNPVPDRYNALSNRLTAANRQIGELQKIMELSIIGEKDPKKIKQFKDNFEEAKKKIYKDYYLNEAELKELNTAGRPSATGATKGSAIPAPPAGFQLTPPPYSPQ